MTLGQQVVEAAREMQAAMIESDNLPEDTFSRTAVERVVDARLALRDALLNYDAAKNDTETK